MAWSGGTYTKGNAGTGGWTGDASLGIGIESGRHDTQDNDFATGINTCLTKDGQNTPTANLPMGGFKHTGAGAATANGQYIIYNQLTDASPLSVDFTNDRVGIGRTPTANMLELGGQATPTMSITSNSVSGVDMNFMSNGTTSARINVTSNHDLRFFTNNTFRVAVTAAGSLTLNTAGAVFAGDFTNATLTSRNYLQTTTANSLTDVGVLPNGTSAVAGVSVLNNSTPTNASYTSIGCNTTDSIITAGRNGSGTYLPMTFYANGAERMRITTAGRVGIANNAPAGTLDVSNVQANNISTAKFVSTIAGDVAQNAVFIGKKDATNGTTQIFMQFAVDSAGTGSGQINANGGSQCAFGTFSDERLKENIENLPSQFSNIMALRPVEFDYKDGSGHQIGFIAQEVMNVYPDLIGLGANDMYTLTDLNKNDARLIKAFQELANMVTDLQTRVTALEGA